MNFRTTLLALASCAALTSAFSVQAEDAPSYANSTLTGNWAGHRDAWAAAGVSTDITYKYDVFGNVSGGVRRGIRNLDNLDVVFGLDGEKLLGSQGTTAVVHFLNNMGQEPNGSLVGSAQGIDNIETTTPTAKLYQAWIQQNWANDRYSLLAGLYDLNSEFYVTDSSLLFLQPTLGIGTDFAQSGENGPSIFPTTSLAARFKFQPTSDSYLQVAVLDAVSGDPQNGNGTHVRVDKKDGALLVSELGYLTGGASPTGKIALGGWYYTEKTADVAASGNYQHNKGFYVLGEQLLCQEAGAAGQGLTGFARFGVADKDVNQFYYSWSTGLVYTGLIPSRDEGKLGLALNGAHNGKKFRNVSAPVDTAETALELTYSDNITPWLTVQPDVQYVINPGANPATKNATVLGSRFTIAF
jgi:porin